MSVVGLREKYLVFADSIVWNQTHLHLLNSRDSVTQQLFATNKRFPIALQVHGLDQGSGKLGESYYSLEPGAGCILSKAPIKKYASAYTVRLQLHMCKKTKKLGKPPVF